MIGDNLRRPPWVIAVAAVSGGEKTTIANGLAQRLPGSRMLSFGDYNFEGPTDILAWVDQGADYHAWDLTPLVEDLQRALAEPCQYIILDYPFAYAQDQVSPYIDVAVFVDIPWGMAVSRRLLRDFRGSSGDAILHDVEHYVKYGRRSYLEQLTSVRPGSDIATDGAARPEAIIPDLLGQLRHG